MRTSVAGISALLVTSLLDGAAGTPVDTIAAAPRSALFFWKSKPVRDTAELVILIRRGCNTSSNTATANADSDIPLLAVLKDTLGDRNPENDRLTAVWLLSYSRPTVWQRTLSAVPFFYWRVKTGAAQPGEAKLKPELDFTSLQHPSLDAVRRDALQWLTLDPSIMPIRATTRAYRTNEMADERLHLEESVSYLRAAVTNDSDGPLTKGEIETLIARLELRKTLLGGFMTEHAAARYGQAEAAERERVRTRNWEILRQCADKTGLRFEPLNLAGTQGEYALLWAPVSGIHEENGSRLDLIWKLLNIRKPSKAGLERLAQAGAYKRALDADGNLMPPGAEGTTQAEFLPLSAYSLNYPKMPLLMVDFRGGRHIRWHAMTQRTINDVTAGVIGISHFTNWYYYVGADLYDLVASRHGAALNQAERLDCYSQFRVALALDHSFDSRLRAQMQAKVNALSMNPLEISPQRELAAASDRADALDDAAEDGQLLKLIDRDRRAELAMDSSSRSRMLFNDVLHMATFGAYTHRARAGAGELTQLDTLRKTQAQLAFLDRATADGTQPEVSVDSARLQSSLSELQHLLPNVTSQELRARASATIARVGELSQNEALRSNCKLTLAAIGPDTHASSQGIALKPAALRPATFQSSSGVPR